jgi:DNA-binding transcriptional LysR family regulator
MKFKQILTLRHLRLILTLGRELSISRSAEVLHTSQSAVSRGLTEIEMLLGAELFKRTTRRFEPTPLGQNLIWHAEQVMSQLDRAEADFNALSRGGGSVINIGVMGGVSPKLLAEAGRLARLKAPDLRLRLLSNFAEGLIPDLVRGRCDIILTHFDVRHFGNEDLVVEVLYQETVEVMAAVDHPLTRRKRLKWLDLAEEQWALIPVETSTRRIVEQNLLLNAGKRNPVIVETMELHYVIEFVRSSGMLTALPSYLAKWFEQELGAVKCLPMADSVAPWAVCAARLKSRQPTGLELLFTEALKTAAAAYSEDVVATQQSRRKAASK